MTAERMASYAAKVTKDIDRWQADGLIAPAQAASLRADLERHARPRVGLGPVIGILAALLIAAAILLMVASNWEAIPRLARVALLCALIAFCFLGGGFAQARARRGRAEALYVIGTAAFGGALALIGQMYHLAGTESDFLVAWGCGAALSAALLRSNALTITAILIAIAWLGTAGLAGGASLYFPIALALLWPLTFWTDCRPGRALIFFALLGWAALLHLRIQGEAVPIIAGLLSIALFFIAAQRPAQVSLAMGSAHAGSVYGLIGFLFASLLLQLPGLADASSVIVAALTLAGTVAAILLSGRESRRVRRIAYAGFTAQLLYVYFVLLGSMIGSAMFFLASGLVLAGIALIISRLERRFADRTA